MADLPHQPLTGCAPAIPRDEERVALLHALDLLDTPPEAEFDAITRLAAQLTGRPIALIGLVDRDRNWFKSRFGLDAAQTPREFAFCAHTIAGEALFEVPDAHADPRFRDNPLVTGAPHVASYAGMPLFVNGLPLGSVCVVDRVAHTLTAAQRAGLEDLARLTVGLLERQLVARAKGRFLGAVSHEMRTPLNAIMGFAELLRHTRRDDPAAVAQLGHIHDAGAKLLAVTDDMLQLMQLELGLQRVHVEHVDLAPLLQSVQEALRPLAVAQGATLQLEVPAALQVRADPQRLRGVLRQLVAHALRQAPPGGAVVLQAGPDGDDLALVTLRAAGRADDGGLGISLARSLVEAMAGRLESLHPAGEPSRFRVRLGRG